MSISPRQTAWGFFNRGRERRKANHWGTLRVKKDAPTKSDKTRHYEILIEIAYRQKWNKMTRINFVLVETSGRFSFTGKLNGLILATVTDRLKNTSGFSNAIAVN